MFEFFKSAMVDYYAEVLAEINPYEEASPDKSEFVAVAKAIVEGFISVDKRDKYTAADVIQPTFRSMRGRALSVRDCSLAVDELLDTFECVEDCFPIYSDSELRPRMVEGNITPVVKVAEHFTIDSFSVGRKSYIYLNEKIYRVVKKDRTADAYKAILNDGDTVYIQYRKPLKNGLESYITKTVDKRRYSYDKLKKKENIIDIFDREKRYDKNKKSD